MTSHELFIFIFKKKTNVYSCVALCLGPKMSTEPHAATLNWREQLTELCEEMGIDQHAPCHDWREQLAALCAEVGVVNDCVV